ncbi:hypothetical protein [Methanolobus bombayensis]|uniref:hypothetical protein n=1 Tax=Methanolobus bombayensis TaxID=38023 RepID=UPI001AE11857|nr:hypothetical protein [Methanolobus bombayensis]MBP1910659.1 hypothetical protein [Methanolobus bombayensis]
MNKEIKIIQEQTDKLVAFFGLICSIVLIIYTSLVIGRIVYIIVGVFTFISCITWLIIRKNASLKVIKSLSATENLSLASLFFIIFLCSTLSFYFRISLYERPLIYFALIALMVCIAAIQIFNEYANTPTILFQIILIGSSVALSQVFLFPSLVGVDPWFHQMFTLDIINSQTIPSGFNYSKIPLFHLLVSSTILVTGLDYKYSTFFSITLVGIICNICFIYLIGKILFNKNIGLLASLLLSIANYHILMAYWPIPNSFAIVFTLIMFYFILKARDKYILTCKIFLMSLIVPIILGHTVTSMFTCISLLVYVLGFKLFDSFQQKKQSTISFLFPLLFLVAMFSWWTFASGHIHTFSNLIKWGFSRDFFVKNSSQVVLHATSVPIYEQLMNNIGMFLFFSLSFIGCFYMISKKYGTNQSFSMSIIGFCPLFLGFFSLVSKHGIIEQRWWYFAQIFLAIPLSISAFLIYNYINLKFKKLASIPNLILICFFLMLTFTLIVSPAANNDNNIFSPNSSPRSALTKSEMESIYFLSGKYNQTIGVDQYLVLINFLPVDMSISTINDEIYSGNFDENKIKFILLRDYIVNNPFNLYSGTYILNYDLYQKFEDQEFDKIYDSKSVNFYLLNN